MRSETADSARIDARRAVAGEGSVREEVGEGCKIFLDFLDIF